MEPLGDLRESREQLDQPLGGDTGGRLVAGWFVAPLKAVPDSRQRLRRGSELAPARLLESVLELVKTFGGDAVGLFARHAFQLQQVIEIAVSHGALVLDGLVEQGLGETGLVGLVMAPAAITVHVDHNVTAEFLAEIQGQVDDLRDRFRVLAVHVENGALQHLGHIAGVRRRPPLFG
jgi:hypothetical protein